MSKGKQHWPGFRAQARQQQPMPSQTQTQTQIQLEEKFYTGPIPEPQALQAYENVSQGLATRIVDMAEKEQGHTVTRSSDGRIWLEYG